MTWADSGKVNIDIDDLFGTKTPKSGPTPSMNDLKSNPSSPIHNANVMSMNMNNFPQQTPLATNLNFNQPMQNNGYSAVPNMFPTNPSLSSNNNNNNNGNSFSNMNANSMFSGANQQFGAQPMGSNQHQAFFQAQFK